MRNPLPIPVKYLILLTVWISSSVMGQQGQALSRLGRLNVNRDFITLSGFSSGGTFAQQLYISYSSLFHGIAVFSHTYYRCGPVTSIQSVYDDVCTTLGNRRSPDLYNPNLALMDIQNYFSSGLIENPNNLANKPLYVFAGTQNWLFTTDMSLRILRIFEPFINNPKAIRTRISNANLTLPTDRPELPACNSPPNALFLSNCGFSGAFESLQFLLGYEAVERSRNPQELQPLISFDQTEFFYGIDGTGRHDMDSIGFLYIPRGCSNAKAKCFVHFYFHGCSNGRQFVGAEHIINSGFLEVAEDNGIIMVFPQAATSTENTIGCWDTYGFTGPLYATQRGGQVTVVRNMLARILGEDGISNGENNFWQPNGNLNIDSTPNQISGQLLSNSISSNDEILRNSGTRCTVSRVDPQTILQHCISG